MNSAQANRTKSSRSEVGTDAFARHRQVASVIFPNEGTQGWWHGAHLKMPFPPRAEVLV